MSRGKYLSLPEARKKKQLDRFCKEHPSEGNADELDRMLIRLEPMTASRRVLPVAVIKLSIGRGLRETFS